MKHYKIKVTGIVQGVYFRALTREKAKALGVKGFVRNEADGSVYLEAEGDDGQLESLIQWCRKGPPRAKIENVVSLEGNFVGYKHFEIMH